MAKLIWLDHVQPIIYRSCDHNITVRNIGFSIASICIWILDFIFFNFLDLDKFFLSALLLPPTSSSASNFIRVKFDNLVVFNIKLTDATILLKSQIKRL